MMTPWHEYAFRITGPLWGDSIGHMQLSLAKSQWASYQIHITTGCACAGNTGNVFPATALKGNRGLRSGMHHGTCFTARAVVHAGIVNLRWRGKRSRHSRRMRNLQFCVSGKMPIAERIGVFFVVSVNKLLKNQLNYHLFGTHWHSHDVTIMS